VHGIVGPSRQ